MTYRSYVSVVNTSGNATPAQCGKKGFAPSTRAPHRPQRAPLASPDLKNGFSYTYETYTTTILRAHMSPAIVSVRCPPISQPLRL